MNGGKFKRKLLEVNTRAVSRSKSSLVLWIFNINPVLLVFEAGNSNPCDIFAKTPDVNPMDF